MVKFILLYEHVDLAIILSHIPTVHPGNVKLIKNAFLTLDGL